jgi:hypothetical protein
MDVGEAGRVAEGCHGASLGVALPRAIVAQVVQVGGTILLDRAVGVGSVQHRVVHLSGHQATRRGAMVANASA